MASYFSASIGEEQQFRVALSNGGLTAELMKAVGNNGDLGKIMVEALKAHLGAESRETFENEQVASSYGYPKGWMLKPLDEQAKTLLKHFPGLDVSQIELLAERYERPTGEMETSGPPYRGMSRPKQEIVLPPGMDGLVVIPKFSVVARMAMENADWPAYNRAMKHLLAVMKKSRKDFVDYTEGTVGPDRLKLTTKTAAAYVKLEELPGDVMVLAVQTGLLHRGKSVRRARATFVQSEFGLDDFAVGCILLAHPERLKDSKSLWIDCAGSERAPRADGDFTSAPFWYFSGGELRFLSHRIDGANPGFGSASAALPE